MMGPPSNEEAEMEALVMTLGLLIVMVAALVALARVWPRSSRRTGYRISGQDRSGPEPPGQEAPVPEDDDVRWRWRDGPR
jgi:hypothetical protein